MKNREIGIGPGRADGDARLPEALAFEGPVTAGSLSIGQRSALELEGGDDVIARAQLVLALKGGGLGPEQLLAGHLGNRPHGVSLSNASRERASCYEAAPIRPTLSWKTTPSSIRRLANVAEGVEDARTWDLLAALACDMAQGYFISPPLLAEEVLPWLASWQGASGKSAHQAA